MKAYVIVGAVCLALGAVGGWIAHRPGVQVRTEYVDRVVTKTVRAPTTRTRDRTTSKLDGTKTVEHTVTVVGGSTTTSTERESGKATETPLPRFSASLLGGAQLGGGWVAGLHAQVRPFQPVPLLVGGWLLGGPNVIAGGGSLGVAW